MNTNITTPPTSLFNKKTVSIDYSQSLEEMLTFEKYDYPPHLVLSNCFRAKYTKGCKDYELKVFQLFDSLTSKEVIELIQDINQENAWKPAFLEHLLVFGAHTQPEQISNPIVALGACGMLSIGKHFPLLQYQNNKKSLSVNEYTDTLPKDYLFLAFREPV